MTQQQCQWVVPSFKNQIPYSSINSIDFTSAKMKERKIDDAINVTLICPPTAGSNKSFIVLAPGENEFNSFVQKLSQCGTKSSVLSLIPPYADNYIPKSSLPTCPKPLLELHQPKFLELDYSHLLSEFESTDIQLTCGTNIDLGG